MFFSFQLCKFGQDVFLVFSLHDLKCTECSGWQHLSSCLSGCVCYSSPLTHTHTHTGFVFKARRETMKHTCRKCKHVSVSRASKAQEVCKLLQSNRLLSLSPSPSLPLSLSLSPSLPLSLSLSPSLCLSINLSLSYLN